MLIFIAAGGPRDGATVELDGNCMVPPSGCIREEGELHGVGAAVAHEELLVMCSGVCGGRSQVLFDRYGHELVDDSVEHGDLGLGAPMSKGVPLESVQHPGDTGLPTEILVHEPGTAPLDHIHLVSMSFWR